MGGLILGCVYWHLLSTFNQNFLIVEEGIALARGKGPGHCVRGENCSRACTGDAVTAMP